jgi:hypothetical protein
MMNITLENLEQYTILLDDHPYKWMFEDSEKGMISEEHKDQIFALDPEASKFLWNMELKFKIFEKDFFQKKVFKENEEWVAIGKSDEETKKWLYNRAIPFSQKVFVSIDPSTAFVLTWKMVIKNFDGLFRSNDQTIWDRTLNWGLAYDHNEIFYFGKNRIYDSDVEAEKIKDHNLIISATMEEIERNKNRQVKKYRVNPYRK